MKHITRKDKTRNDNYRIYHEVGVGPFILGRLKDAVINAETAKKLLKNTPSWDIERKKYLEHVVEEGEKVKPILENYLKELEKKKRHLGK